MTKGKVLVLGSNATRIEVQGGGTGPTGNYLNETVVPAMALIEAGYNLVLATPNGTKPHIDEASDSAVHFGGDQAAYSRAKAFWANDPAVNQVSTLRSVIKEGLDGYAGVFVPGGQAPVVDLMQDPDAGEILRHFHQHSKPTALLCHGPIALVSAMPHAREFRAALIAGDEKRAKEWAKGWQYADYKMTIFSASEEKWVENDILHAKMYFNMPYALSTAGGKVITGSVDFAPHVIVDRELITGQNPRSDHPIAAKLIEALADCLTSAAKPDRARKEATMKKVLITGAGTGFGHEVAMRLALKGFDVIAAVEIYAQVQTLKREAAARGATLRVEKLDVTNEGDRKKALAWNIEILVNNAGVLEGGSVLDIPGSNMRHEFEVNVIGPLLLTQGIAKQMVKRGKGRIVWVSSREGLNTNPFTGIYSASKHALEAVAETMSLELQEFGIEVATINPGPFLTGFNDRGFQTWQSWEDDASERLFDYSKLAFPRAQFDPEPVYATMTAVAAGEIDTYRNLEPKSMLEETKRLIEAPWNKKVKDGLGTRPASLQKSYEMKPETPVAPPASLSVEPRFHR